jgi:hypothetical protein
MSALTVQEEFTDTVFTRDRAAWWSALAVPGVNVCTDRRMTVEEAFDEYLPWEVRKVQLADIEFAEPRELVDPHGVVPVTARPAADIVDVPLYLHKRSDDNAVIGNSTSRCVIFQNHEARDMLAAALDGTDYAVASIGALKRGALTFVSVDFTDLPDINIAGQTILPYLCLVNAMDGRGALRGYASGVRPECLNTISLGWLAGTQLGRIVHSTNMASKVPELQAEIRRYLDLVPQAERMVGRLINARLAPADLSRAIDAMTPVPDEKVKDGKVANRATITRATERRDAIRELALSDDRVGFVGTAWGLFQAFSTYQQWEKGFRRTATSGVSSRQGATLVEHFTGKQELNDSKLMRMVLRYADVTGVKVTTSGLVATS